MEHYLDQHLDNLDRAAVEDGEAKRVFECELCGREVRGYITSQEMSERGELCDDCIRGFRNADDFDALHRRCQMRRAMQLELEEEMG